MGGRRRRFGRVRQLPSGRWQARYAGPDGQDRPAPDTFRTKRDAEVWLSQAETEMQRGQWIDPDAGMITVGEWATRWLTSVSPTLKVKTQAFYESLLRSRLLPTFGEVPLSAVRPIDVAEWIGAMSRAGLGASRVRQSYRLLSQVMAAAVNNDLISTSPCRGVRLPRLPETEPVILTEDQALAIAEVMPRPHDVIILLLAYGGLRIGEAFALRRKHVDVSRGRIVVRESLVEVGGRLTFDTPKSHQHRVIALPGFVVERLRAHLTEIGDSPDELLFVGRTGRPIHYNSWRRTRFDPGMQAIGLSGVTPHDLRASHATWVADKYGVIAAARRLGHSNASVTTRHYARAIDGRDDDVARGFDR
jgi:integrase